MPINLPRFNGIRQNHQAIHLKEYARHKLIHLKRRPCFAAFVPFKNILLVLMPAILGWPWSWAADFATTVSTLSHESSCARSVN